MPRDPSVADRSKANMAAWWSKSVLRPASTRPVLLLQNVEPYGEADDESLDDQLVERGNAKQAHAVVQHADDQRADDGAADRAGAAGEAGAADHYGGDS